MKTFNEVERELSKLVRPSGMSGGYTLDNMMAIMEYLGNPQNSFRTVHIAGTSGKTSTAYYTADLLSRSGLKVGLTTSPHVDQINERTQINMQRLPEAEYCQEFSKFFALVRASSVALSYYEIMIAFAFWLFAKKGCDVAVVEVGLGGLLDATNVFNRTDNICVITDIGLDHVEVLGGTIPEIAAQKAGIIKPGNTVFMNQQAGEVVQVVAGMARSADASLHVLAELLDVELPPFQQRNFSLACKVAQCVVGDDLDVSHQITVPGRMEILEVADKTVVLDGSHNAQKLAALADGVEAYFGNRSRVVLLAIGSNKHSGLEDALREIKRISDSIVITTFSKGQDEVRTAIDPTEIADTCEGLGFNTIAIVDDSAQAYQQCLGRDFEVLIVTGSYFLVQELRPIVLA